VISEHRRDGTAHTRSPHLAILEAPRPRQRRMYLYALVHVSSAACKSGAQRSSTRVNARATSAKCAASPPRTHPCTQSQPSTTPPPRWKTSVTSWCQ
jgi:hypothetical protein